MSAVITALLNATTKQVNATIMVQYHLYAVDQFFGFSESLIVHVTNSYLSVLPVLCD